MKFFSSDFAKFVEKVSKKAPAPPMMQAARVYFV